MKSIIVFSERCTLKKVTVNSPDILVVKRNHLVKPLKKLIKNSHVKLDEMQINDIYNNLKRFCNVPYSVKEITLIILIINIDVRRRIFAFATCCEKLKAWSNSNFNQVFKYW